MTDEELSIRDKILTSMYLSYNMLIEKKQKDNGELYFSYKGQIVEKKACDLTPIEINISPIK